MPDYEYDVAFSFHQADEGLALQLNDLLSDRFRTFIYTDQQKNLAGRDGEEAFSEVYAKKARIVVVFCRQAWGETPFTRIEQTAIRGRAFDEGYEFTLFIPTETLPKVPAWLPRLQLYYGMERFGLDGAAAVVEQKIQLKGGEVREESLADRAARAVRAAKLAEERRLFLHSNTGVDAAKAAYSELLSGIRDGVEEANGAPGMALMIAEHSNEMVIYGLEGSTHIWFRLAYTNVLEDFPVAVNYADGPPKVHWLMAFDEPRKWAQDRFQYTLLGPDRPGYQDVSNANRVFTPGELAKHVLTRYIDLSERV